MIIIPIKVKNNDELEVALKQYSLAIEIDNEELFKQVKKKSLKYRVEKKIGKYGVLGAAAIFVGGLVAPEALVGVILAGVAGSATAGVVCGFDALTSGEIKHYKIKLDDKKQTFLLVRENELKRTYGKKKYVIEGYDCVTQNPNKLRPIIPANEKEAIIAVKEKHPSILIQGDFYNDVMLQLGVKKSRKERVKDSALSSALWDYSVFKSSKAKQILLLDRKKYNYNTCRVVGVDMNNLILDNK